MHHRSLSKKAEKVYATHDFGDENRLARTRVAETNNGTAPVIPDITPLNTVMILGRQGLSVRSLQSFGFSFQHLFESLVALASRQTLHDHQGIKGMPGGQLSKQSG